MSPNLNILNYKFFLTFEIQPNYGKYGCYYYNMEDDELTILENGTIRKGCVGGYRVIR